MSGQGRVEPLTFAFREERRPDDPAYGGTSVADTFPLLDQNEPVKQEITAIHELTDPANAVPDNGAGRACRRTVIPR